MINFIRIPVITEPDEVIMVNQKPEQDYISNAVLGFLVRRLSQ